MLPGAALGRFRAVFCTIPVRFVSAVALVAPRQQPPLRTSKSVSLTKAVNFGVVAVFCNLTCSHLKP